MAIKKLLAPLLIVALFCSPVFAWGSKEHMLLTRLAILRLLNDATTPADMKTWLKTLQPELGTVATQQAFFMKSRVGAASGSEKGISWWVVQPDARSGDKKTPVPPFEFAEQKLHFTDMENLNADVDKRAYKHDMSDAPDLNQVPRDIKDERWKEAGILPFAVENSYKELVKSIKAGRLSADDRKDEDNAVRWAAFLAHYTEDNTQPLHATEDYQCKRYFADRRGAPNVHSEMEYKMNDDEKNDYPKLRADYWKLLIKQLDTFKDPITTKDLWLATLQVSLESYKQIPLIGLAAMQASGQQGTPEKPTGRAGPIDTDKFFRYSSEVTGTHETVMQMKARQQAWAVVRVAEVWRRAWDEGKGK
ncbi:MAG: hypothetical protein JWM57_1844 [Phycisphaerales bacterium]|nr:hypothetical protein [Phycisphaerales bacterium]